MYSNLNPGVVKIRADYQRTIELARGAGFGGIDIPTGEIKSDTDAAKRRLDEAALRAGGFNLPVEFRKDEDTYKTGMNELAEHARAAQAVGCTRCVTWILPYHDELDYRQNFDRHVQRLEPAAATLAEHGVRFGIEFVGPKTMRDGHKYEFVHDIDQCLELADAIGSDTGVLLDCWHWYTSGATEQDIVDKLDGRVVYVHVNDAPEGRERDEQIDNDRRLPLATGVIDAEAFVRALRKIGYDGPVTAEPFYPPLADQPPEQTARQVGESVQKMLALA